MPRRNVDISDIRNKAREAKNQESERITLTDEDIKKALVPNAYKEYRCILRFWIEFTEECLDEDDIDRICDPLRKPPSLSKIHFFLTWLARTRAGLLDTTIVKVTLENKLGSLKRAIKLRANYVFTKPQNIILKEHVEQVVALEGVSTKAYAKPIAGLDVAEDLIEFLWKCDEYEFTHPRMRLQLVFSIILFTFLGSRPGEIIESEAWKDSNEGLWYGDIELSRQNTVEYKGLVLHVRLRNRKCQRKNEANTPTLVLYEDFEKRHLCPVSHFLALALTDGAIYGCNTFQDVQKRRIPLGSDCYRFRIEPDKENVPFIRSMNRDGTVSESKILTYNCLNLLIRGVGQRAGYEQRLSAYCFRRGFANAVNKHSSSAERRHLMGQNNEEAFQYYISVVSGVDSQSIVQGKAPKTKFIEFNQSMKRRRNIEAPKPQGSLLTDVQPINTEPVEIPQLSSKKQYEIRRQMRGKMYIKQRKEFFEFDVYDQDSGQGVDSDQDSGQGADSDQDSGHGMDSDEDDSGEKRVMVVRSPSRYLTALLRYDLPRRWIIEVLFDQKDESLSKKESLSRVVERFRIFAAQKHARSCYPRVRLGDDGCCQDCNKSLSQGRIQRKHAHLLQCTQRRLIKGMRQEMQRHFESTVRTCLWNDCRHRFNGKPCGTYSLHVTRHITLNKANQCLWNRCGHIADTPYDLALHVSAEHNVPNERTLPTRMHFCYEHAQFFAADGAWIEHCRSHLSHLNDFCGLIRRRGLVVVAAHCPLCLGDLTADACVRWAQFHDVFTLHKHIKRHLAALASPPDICPYPDCETKLGTEVMFWQHANEVHGIPPFGASPGNRSLKRKIPPDDLDDETQMLMLECGEDVTTL